MCFTLKTIKIIVKLDHLVKQQPRYQATEESPYNKILNRSISICQLCRLLRVAML